MHDIIVIIVVVIVIIIIIIIIIIVVVIFIVFSIIGDGCVFAVAFVYFHDLLYSFIFNTTNKSDVDNSKRL